MSRWFSGQTRPDFVACLQLAEITHRPPVEVLEAFGHDPRPLRVVYESDPQRGTPPSVQQRTVDTDFDYWMRVMGPLMGEDRARDTFWAGQIRTSSQSVATAEAVNDSLAHSAEQTAVNHTDAAAVSDRVSGPKRPTNTPPGDTDGPLGICKTPPIVRLRELAIAN